MLYYQDDDLEQLVEKTHRAGFSLLGSERANRWKPFRSILDAGGLVAGGSDAPVTRMSPLKGIQACIDRARETGGFHRVK